MHEHLRSNYLIPAAAIFTGLPLLLWALGDFPRRTLLKESLSLLFILAFCLMIGQFFLSRGNRSAVQSLKMNTVIKFHKVIGYLCAGVLLLHPFLLVVPRYFEAGVAPREAFTTMITTFDSPGIGRGIIAWVFLLLLGILSLLRKRLPLRYTTWRTLHGIQSMVLLAVATWHVLDLGRHFDMAMSIYFIILAVSGELLLLKTYILKPAETKKAAS